MAITKAALFEAIEAYLPETEVEADELPRMDLAMAAAFAAVSRDRPRSRGAALTANPAAVPGGWDEDFSEILEAHWPYLEEADGIIKPALKKATVNRETDGTIKIRIPNAPVAEGADKAYVLYTVPWSAANLAAPDGDGKFPASLDEPLKALAAAIYADMLAGFFESAASPSTGDIQLLDAGAKADSYRAHGKALRQSYAVMLGLDPDRYRALMGFAPGGPKE